MVLPASQYQQARREAKFHVQVELIEVASTVDTPGEVSVCGRVVHAFRGREPLSPGDTVNFAVAAIRPGDEVPDGGALWIDYEKLVSSRFMEVFLNGDPPDCRVALWQCQLVDSPSPKSTMDG